MDSDVLADASHELGEIHYGVRQSPKLPRQRVSRLAASRTTVLINTSYVRTVGSLGSSIVDEPRVDPVYDVRSVDTIACHRPRHRGIEDGITDSVYVASVVYAVLVRDKLAVSVH